MPEEKVAKTLAEAKSKLEAYAEDLAAEIHGEYSFKLSNLNSEIDR